MAVDQLSIFPAQQRATKSLTVSEGMPLGFLFASVSVSESYIISSAVSNTLPRGFNGGGLLYGLIRKSLLYFIGFMKPLMG